MKGFYMGKKIEDIIAYISVCNIWVQAIYIIQQDILAFTVDVKIEYSKLSYSKFTRIKILTNGFSKISLLTRGQNMENNPYFSSNNLQRCIDSSAIVFQRLPTNFMKNYK